MNKIKLIVPIIALTFAVGCSSIKISPSTVQQGVATGVSYSVIKYPQVVPYLRAADDLICSAANGTNISPAQVIAAIERAPSAAVLKTPEGVLILNAALTLYVGVWESYGVNAVNNAPTLQLYLKATCSGIAEGLPSASGNLTARRVSETGWPLVKF